MSIILCLNRGSSSLKFALYEISDAQEKLLSQGEIEEIGSDQGRFWIQRSGDDSRVETRQKITDSTAAMDAAFAGINRLSLPLPEAVGHRVVHGGPDHIAPLRIDAALLGSLRKLTPFAPLHMPLNIEAIEAAIARFPDLPQVACFDTAFHQQMPQVASRLALPHTLWDEGIRRYGFHGISYEYIMQTLGEHPPAKIVIAHLGNGASMVAVRDGMPVDTTMGLSPCGGIVMGTRSGDLDPGVILFLLNEKKLSTERLSHLLNQESGLLGISGISSDMKTLVERSATDSNAELAVQIFCYGIRKQVGSYSAVLGGIDLLVFTAGIGEHAPIVREQSCQGLEFLGIEIDPQRNRANANVISRDGSRCVVRVIPTNEDLMIARHTHSLVS